MHEEATSMSVPSSVAASTAQNENGTSTVSVVNAEVDLEVTTDNDNVELQVPFSTNSGGKFPYACHVIPNLQVNFELCCCLRASPFHKPVFDVD